MARRMMTKLECHLIGSDIRAASPAAALKIMFLRIDIMKCPGGSKKAGGA